MAIKPHFLVNIIIIKLYFEKAKNDRKIDYHALLLAS